MVTAIVGTQWGDEGKGRVSYFETRNANVVVRCTGGNNAGHTVVSNGQKYALHLLPSSIINPSVMSVIGTGVVINPESLISEIRLLSERGVEITPKNLLISNRAHVILPIHVSKDKAEEVLKVKFGLSKVGTTGRGIGPAYEDVASRYGIHMYDLLGDFETLSKKIKFVAYMNNFILGLANMNHYPDKECEQIAREYLEYGEYLKAFISDTKPFFYDHLDKESSIVLEGAQAAFLDVEQGRPPFSTASHPTASGSCTGAGLGPLFVNEVIGVMKAYTSRVGEGPFPTEQKNEIGNKIMKLGHEYGTTTGRPRRCGWLDLVMIKDAVKINSCTCLALNHLDTIGKLSEIKVCIGYKYHGKVINYVPVDHENCEPIYKTFCGNWSADGITKFDHLPEKAKRYIDFIEEYTGVTVVYIGTGPDNEKTIVR